jgi:serine/threonine protein phosphatase PrpC
VRRDACARTNTGKVRTNNEDSFLIDERIGLYLLADGMGGARGGEHASKLAVETVHEFFARDGDRRDVSGLLEAVEHANERIYLESKAEVKLEGMGTTLVAALDLKDSFAIASVGDSRAYLCDQQGFRAITEDQTWVEDVGKPLGLDDEALSRHPMRHVLTMALGVGVSLDVRYYKVAFPVGSLLLLSSDGLHGVISADQIEAIIRENRPGHATLDEKCSHLIQAARQAGGPDNITVILIRG